MGDTTLFTIWIEKIRIDQEIKKHQDQKVDLKTTENNIELERTDLNARMNDICNELNAEAEQHDQNVQELTEIIEEMKMKIIKKLNEKDDAQSTESASRQQDES